MTTPPMGSETQFAEKIGREIARQMAKGDRRAHKIPPHRWAQKAVRFGQRVLFVAFFAASVKFAWPWYVQVIAALMALRALSPDLADGIVKWGLAIAKQGKAIKNGGE